MTEYIDNIQIHQQQHDYGNRIEEKKTNISQSTAEIKQETSWFKSLTKSFEEEGLFGLSFGIVNAVTSTALHVVADTASNVTNILTNHENNHDRILTKSNEETYTSKPTVFQFASYLADIVLSTVSPVLDLHFFGHHPSRMNDVQLSMYWDSTPIKKSIGYNSDACSFMGTESVYFDTSSVKFYSAMTGEEQSMAESIRMEEDDFYSAVSREEVEEMEIEFV